MDLRISVVICTYMRPQPVLRLLKSVEKQSLYPNEILIVDGSTNDKTKAILGAHTFKNLNYYSVDEANRGLTNQRNFGISKIDKSSEIIAFLDDDTELTDNYFEALVEAFSSMPEVVGVGGLAINENRWQKKEKHKTYSKLKYYELDDYVIQEGQRNRARKVFGLQSDKPPMVMPSFSHGISYGYPFNDKVYEVDLLIGMSFAFRKLVFDNIKFSTYFQGYGLYEDADFSLRALKYGKNVISTKVQLYHYHDAGGRPNQFKYGKMVLRNGWYVWRIKYPKPRLRSRLKWHATAFLLTVIRLSNVITTENRSAALTESLGRVLGWWSLLFNPPEIER